MKRSAQPAPAERTSPMVLWLSPLAASVAAVVVFRLAQSLKLGLSVGALLALAAGTLLGYLLCLGLQRDLQLVELALARLARGLPIPSLQAQRPGGTGLLLQVRALSERLSEQLQREQQVGEVREQLLQQVTQTAAQEERNRLARDLHDSIKQQIFSIGISIAAAQARWQRDPAGSQAALEDARRSVHEAQVEMRALLQQLRPAPLETVGLIEALRDQCEALGYRSGAAVRVEFASLPAEERMPPGAQEALFRIAQEGLANIARHARARHVLLRLAQQGDELLLELVDDGQGFEPSATASGMGITNMRERAQSLGGSLELLSVRGKGTTIRVRLPLATAADQLRHEEVMGMMNTEARALTRRCTRRQWLVVLWSSLALAILAVFTKPLYFLWLERRWLGQASGLLIPMSIVVILVLLLLASLVYTLVQVRRTALQLRISQGESSPARLQVRRSGQLGRVALCLWSGALLSFMALLPFSSALEALSSPGVAAMTAWLFCLLALVELWRYLHTSERYYSSLAPHELFQQLTSDRRLINGILLVGALLTSLTFNDYLSWGLATWGRNLPEPLWLALHHGEDESTILVYVLLALLSFSWWQIYRWERQLTRTEAWR